MVKRNVIGLFVSMFMITFMAACGGETNDNANENENNDDVNYSEAVDYTITGIEPGAGISVTTERALEEYDELQGWEVELSSTGAMMSELDTKIENEEPIIETGWNPHWMFAKYPDLKYLDDPDEIYGGTESIHSLTRLGFAEDHPEAKE